MSVTSFQELHTPRLSLRRLLDSDAEDVAELRSDDQVNEYLTRPARTSLAEAREFISSINEGISQKNWFYWAITFKEDKKLLGTACIWNFSDELRSAELGYELSPAAQGKGIMREALKSIIAFGFQNIHLKTIHANTHKDNRNSTQLLHRLSFSSEGVPSDNPDFRIFTLDSFSFAKSFPGQGAPA